MTMRQVNVRISWGLAWVLAFVMLVIQMDHGQSRRVCAISSARLSNCRGQNKNASLATRVLYGSCISGSAWTSCVRPARSRPIVQDVMLLLRARSRTNDHAWVGGPEIGNANIIFSAFCFAGRVNPVPDQGHGTPEGPSAACCSTIALRHHMQAHAALE